MRPPMVRVRVSSGFDDVGLEAVAGARDLERLGVVQAPLEPE